MLGRLKGAGPLVSIGLILIAYASRSAAMPTSKLDSARVAVPVTVRDLASLSDFGRADNGDDQGPAVAISPDGRRAAMLVRTPDLIRNNFQQDLIVLSLPEGRRVATVRVAAQPVFWALDVRGFRTLNGNFVENPPTWSPDGTTVAFLVPGEGGVQVAVIDLATGSQRIVTSSPGGASDVTWDMTGKGLVFATRAGLPAWEDAIDREAHEGYHYDRRVSPMAGPRPMIPASLKPTYRYVELESGVERAVVPGDRDAGDPASPEERPAHASAFAATATRSAWIAPSDPGRWGSPSVVTAKIDGRTIACSSARCRGRLSGMWWVGHDVLFFKREGWGESVTALYAWEPGAIPRRILATHDILVGCVSARAAIVCGRESSIRPRFLWSLDIRSGRQRTVFDPNPAFVVDRQLRVRRLHWRGQFGSEGYGDLVVPATPPPGQGYPLVVVQYHTRGFLRGAVGDEYPIYPLAARGFAVLSIEAPRYYPLLVSDDQPRTIEAAMRLAQQDNNERRLQQSNLERGIASARRTIRVDPARIAITGISDAASSAVFALNNSRLFSVAALGSPDIDHDTLALGGPALAEEFHALGYPSAGVETPAFYRPLSLSANMDRLNVPILFQLPEAEYLGGLPSFARLASTGSAVDLYIFPGENHVKSQPAHKLAVYARNMRWLSFWLLGGEPVTAEDQNEYERWRALRDRGCQLTPPRRLPAQLCSQASTLTRSEMRK